MGFMERQIEFGSWVLVDGINGIEVIPADLISEETLDAVSAWVTGNDIPAELDQYLEQGASGVYSVELTEGWGARLSASGYLDCTPWAVYPSEHAAAKALSEMFGGG